MAQLSIEINSFTTYFEYELDDRLEGLGTWIHRPAGIDARGFVGAESYKLRGHHIPCGSSGDIIRKILSRRWVSSVFIKTPKEFKDIFICIFTIKNSNVFNKLIEMQKQPKYFLGDFNINQVDGFSGNSLLHWAAILRDINLAKFLFKSKGKSQLRNLEGKTPCDYANCSESTEFKKDFLAIAETIEKRVSFCYAFNKMIEQDKNLPYIPKEIVEVIGRYIRPIFTP